MAWVTIFITFCLGIIAGAVIYDAFKMYRDKKMDDDHIKIKVGDIIRIDGKEVQITGVYDDYVSTPEDTDWDEELRQLEEE